MRTVLCFLTPLLLGLQAVTYAQFAMHVIDVGQGDATLLEFNDAAILIDAGAESTGDNRYKEHFLSDLNAFFARRGDFHRTLRAIIVTHPHIDHTRLLMDVMDNVEKRITVEYFYDGGDLKGSGAPQLRQAREYASAHGIKYGVIRDDTIGNEGLTPDGLKTVASGADVRFLAGSRGCANGNNNSLVVRVHYGDKTVLLTGDAETDDDEDCEEGQVDHLLEHYQGTDLLRADVYKVGHHGSHNGTDQALVSAVSPAVAIISAGRQETKGPGTFHGFFFGHPREDVVELLEATAGNRTPPVSAYTYLKGTKDKNANGNMIEGREIGKAIYCTCWDGDLTVSMNRGSNQLVVALGDYPNEGPDRPKRINSVELGSHPAASPSDLASFLGAAQASLSNREHIGLAVLFILIPIFIYTLMRAYEGLRQRQSRMIALDLIQRAKEEDWQLTRFELGAWIHRNHAEESILRRFMPRPRLSIDEVLEQAVAVLLAAPEDARLEASKRKTLIKRLESLHSDPNNRSDVLGPSPSFVFLIAAVPVIVLFLAIQMIPKVGDHLAGFFGPNSILEELWTGLLASIVGTGATLLGKKSVERAPTSKTPPKSQRVRAREKKKEQITSEEKN